MYHHVVTGLCNVKSYFVYNVQHDWHLTQWLKHNFNLTVAHNEMTYNKKEWLIAYEGDWDLDVKFETGENVFSAALEYSACYNARLFDILSEIEMGVEND